MSLLNALMGNANAIDAQTATAEVSNVLMQGETVTHAFKTIRDLIIFTDRRLLLVDKQGVTGKKIQYHSIPYRMITHFSVSTAGTMDVDSEMIVAVQGGGVFQKDFGRGVDILGIQQVLAAKVFA